MMLVPRKNNFSLGLLDSMFDDPFFKGGKTPLLKTDIKEKDNEYIIQIDIPGFEKEDLNVEFSNGYLTVCGEQKKEKEEKDKEGNLIHQERYFGSCQRSYYLGEGINKEEIKAQYNNGTLKLVVPKKEIKELEENNKIQIN